MVRWAFLLLAVAFLERRDAFPESGDPITQEPPLDRPTTKSYTVQIFDQAACSSWDTVLTSLFEPPPQNPWSRIILDFSASENGTQFDRYGAFWLGGVELLRTTTAEPTAEGVVWVVEKDVTAYASLFAQPSTASLSIPNNVDSTYTGIPLVTLSFTFYTASDEYPAPATATVLPLSNSPGDWDKLSVSEGTNLTYSLTLPYDDVLGVQLELMASAHGCEEFWYTNSDDDSAKLGLCGGGVYRELQVYVDGILAGATYPFPVIYTGGINPFLWRPLTGIMSFDIPAYRFDLSPFVLGDGLSHEVVLKVLGGDAEGGVWFLDAALLLYRDADAAPVSGGLVGHVDSGSTVTTNSSLEEGGGYSWNTTGAAEHRQGRHASAGQRRAVSVEHKQSAGGGERAGDAGADGRRARGPREPFSGRGRRADAEY
ncbi:peptide N-acetyl-beta-D-glucosaminyl asparaginase amidase A-domain-containing protein [Ochromonadaceae sp. CCMP2298]|nr:peptide N-acetyl-beta-D-glucosaminyl asparaginase amidase A-domain-containing protein [Ochromonadaceae sp. CCMP2298]